MKKCMLLFAVIVFFACKKNEQVFDASGTFEAEETIIPAQANGTINALALEEGQNLKAGLEVGYIDTVQLFLKKKQLLAQIRAVLGKRPDVVSQTAALEAQLSQAERERNRIQNLLKADAATQKQLDDANAQVSILKKQLEAQRSSLGIASSGFNEETLPLQVQIEQINDQLLKSRIVNPVNGTVLSKYAQVNEMAAIGKPLYKIADLSTLMLRAYITGDQFDQLRLGQKVKVYTDENAQHYKVFDGVVDWISNKAEFTPKTIQTKDERANLVYAVKVRVKNEGALKIGMYGEVTFK
jgi:HlyD family secretion protein